MKQKILVAGSSNTDMVVRSPRLPMPGETIIGGEFLMNPGGKGANQAVAAARLGGEVIFCCKLGEDIFGRSTRQQFEQEGIDTRFVFTDARYPSGVALINVDERGENCISVAPGANEHLLPEDLNRALSEVQNETGIVLVQLEIPLETVQYAVTRSAGEKKIVILNPAPAQQLPFELYPLLDWITPNESEAEILTGIAVKNSQDASKAANRLRTRGVKWVVITMGAQGAFLSGKDREEWIPAKTVKALDTTAAGDVFNGALAVALSEGMDPLTAVQFASAAATLSVTRLGAQASAPYRHECP
jgi:ribokinase